MCIVDKIKLNLIHLNKLNHNLKNGCKIIYIFYNMILNVMLLIKDKKYLLKNK
jgi:hypothetical protein